MNTRCLGFIRVALRLGILRLSDAGVSGSAILHYEFSTNLLDSSSNALHGKVSGTPSYVAGPYGYGSALCNGKIVAWAGPPPSPRLARLFVGGQPGQSAFFSGLLDDVRLDNEALSETQIRQSLDTHPPLSIARDASRVLLTWPASADYFVLEQRTALAQDAANWRPVTASSSVASDCLRVALERILPDCFFRLRVP